jgi:hypothetical protein
MASVASTYARAFADVVFNAHLDVSRAIGGLRQMAALVHESSELRRVWENPAVPADQKRKLLDVIVERGGIERPVRNLVAVPRRKFPAPANWATPKNGRWNPRSPRRPVRKSVPAMDWTDRYWAARWSASVARFTTVR